MDKRARIDELVELLNEASEAYYGGREEIMSNYEWDSGFDELQRLEEETGYVRDDSPTVVVSDSSDNVEGQKEQHEFPALSLAKTKKISDLQKWAEDKAVYLSWKLDGLTLVATYDNGSITRLLTRGNGSIGTNITYMKTAIVGLPQSIEYKGHLVVRGEATISYPDFERINENLEEGEEEYANPRNLASGTLALDAKHLAKVAERCVTFNAFTLVYLDDDILSWGKRMDYLKELGFITVDYEKTDAAGLPDCIARWTARVENGEMPVPVDGLVIAYDDTAYAATGSVTGHHATRAGYAFKWQDTAAKTLLDHVEWSCAASVICPVAVFAPVKLEGTTVSRASLCNLSELERLGIGEDGKTELMVIKSNKIIPKVVQVLSSEGSCRIPEHCPVCGADTEIFISSGGTKVLRCINKKCPAKNLKKYTRFVSKAGMDIDGLSTESLRDFVREKFINDFADIYSLDRHAERIAALEGYGEISCTKLLAAIEKSRDVHPVNFLTALSIPMIGREAAMKILTVTGWEGFVKRLEEGSGFEDVAGIGTERSGALTDWYADEDNARTFKKLLEILKIENTAPAGEKSGSCKGLTFVITGDVAIFANRDEFKRYVESQGGKVTGSVTKKTDYLVNNDINSTTAKNLKAAELGKPIISENTFVEMFGK